MAVINLFLNQCFWCIFCNYCY